MINTDIELAQASPRMNSTTKILKKSSNFFKKKLTRLSRSNQFLDKIDEESEPVTGMSCPADYCSSPVQIKIRKEQPREIFNAPEFRFGKSWSPKNKRKELVLSPLVMPDKPKLPVAIEVLSSVDSIQSRVIYINQNRKSTITPPAC